jgi:hypothetical protein
MKPTEGSAPNIIAQALELGILCRPMHSSRVGVGEALVVSRDLFWIKDGYEGRLKVFSPSPDELMQDWELTTTDLIRAEWQKSCEEPF